MSTEALTRSASDVASQQVLRLALAGTLGIALPTLLEIPMAFIGAVIAVNSAATMRKLPHFRLLLGLIVIVFAVPYAFNVVSGAFLEYPYLLVGFLWLVLFHGYRLQANPNQKLLGVLAVSFAIIVPIVTHAATEIGAVFVYVMGLNMTAGLLAVVIAFAAFPDPGSPAPLTVRSHDPIAPPENAALQSAINATVMAALMAWFLAYDAVTAMRALFVASTILAASEAKELERQSWFALAAVGVAGLAAIGISLFWIILPVPLVGLLLGCLATLLLGQRAIEGPNAPAYANGLASMWVLLSTNGTNPAAQVVTWSLYAMTGACVAVAGRAMLMRLTRK